ncbi:MAG TPA: enoyl-CoA hydratase/isomerase family protein [Baekduia sp.]
MSSDDVLLFRREGAVGVVTLNRPEVRNALDVALMDALRALWSDRERLAGLRCLVLTGAGKGFCSGADVSLLNTDRADAKATAADELAFLPGPQVAIPVIVAVNGVCAGGGLHFVADADIVIAGEHASFLDPHVTVGQVTALEPLTLLPRVRFDAIARMALLGASERLDAARALDAGLVSEVVPDADLLPRALELAGRIAANSPRAVQESRRALRLVEERLLSGLLDEGWAAIRAHWDHPDATEGPAAFLEKREPRWEEPG